MELEMEDPGRHLSLLPFSAIREMEEAVAEGSSGPAAAAATADGIAAGGAAGACTDSCGDEQDQLHDWPSELAFAIKEEAEDRNAQEGAGEGGGREQEGEEDEEEEEDASHSQLLRSLIAPPPMMGGHGSKGDNGEEQGQGQGQGGSEEGEEHDFRDGDYSGQSGQLLALTGGALALLEGPEGDCGDSRMWGNESGSDGGNNQDSEGGNNNDSEGGSGFGGSKSMRLRFTQEQCVVLEKSFCENRNLSAMRRSKLAAQLGVQPRQVAIWFQNRRARLRYKMAGQQVQSMSSKYSEMVERSSKLEQRYECLKQDHKRVLEQNANLRCQISALTSAVSKLAGGREPASSGQGSGNRGANSARKSRSPSGAVGGGSCSSTPEPVAEEEEVMGAGGMEAMGADHEGMDPQGEPPQHMGQQQWWGEQAAHPRSGSGSGMGRSGGWSSTHSGGGSEEQGPEEHGEHLSDHMMHQQQPQQRGPPMHQPLHAPVHPAAPSGLTASGRPMARANSPSRKRMAPSPAASGDPSGYAHGPPPGVRRMPNGPAPRAAFGAPSEGPRHPHSQGAPMMMRGPSGNGRGPIRMPSASSGLRALPQGAYGHPGEGPAKRPRSESMGEADMAGPGGSSRGQGVQSPDSGASGNSSQHSQFHHYSSASSAAHSSPSSERQPRSPSSPGPWGSPHQGYASRGPAPRGQVASAPRMGAHPAMARPGAASAGGNPGGPRLLSIPRNISASPVNRPGSGQGSSSFSTGGGGAYAPHSGGPGSGTGARLPHAHSLDSSWGDREEGSPLSVPQHAGGAPSSPSHQSDDHSPCPPPPLVHAYGGQQQGKGGPGAYPAQGSMLPGLEAVLQFDEQMEGDEYHQGHQQQMEDTRGVPQEEPEGAGEMDVKGQRQGMGGTGPLRLGNAHHQQHHQQHAAHQGHQGHVKAEAMGYDESPTGSYNGMGERCVSSPSTSSHGPSPPHCPELSLLGGTHGASHGEAPFCAGPSGPSQSVW